MKIGYTDIGQVAVTMEAEQTVQPGMAVAMAGNGKVDTSAKTVVMYL